VLAVDNDDPKVPKVSKPPKPPVETFADGLEEGPDAGKENKPAAEELEEEPNGGEENKLVG